jgi:integrase/recombinase XerD
VRVSGPLEAYATGFREELSTLGYSARSAAGHLQLMAHLSRSSPRCVDGLGC